MESQLCLQRALRATAKQGVPSNQINAARNATRQSPVSLF